MKPRVTENCFAALVRAFKASPKFLSLRPASQDLWGRELDFACRPTLLGAVLLEEIRPALVQQYLDGWSDKPGKQAAALAAFKALEWWAIVRDLLARPITLGVETSKPTGGHKPWTDEQVALGESSARADLRRVITLGANTGQRGSDLVRMGWGDIEILEGRPGINVTQVKTGREVWVPILKPLRDAMGTWERRPGPFLLTPWGEPWDRQQLTEAWTNPALRPLLDADLVLHGLRRHACVRLHRAGLNSRDVSVLVGMSVPMVERYCPLSDQKKNALAAVLKLEPHKPLNLKVSR